MRCARPIDSWAKSESGLRCTCNDGNDLLLPANGGRTFVQTKSSGGGSDSSAVDVYVKIRRDVKEGYTGSSNRNWFSLLPHVDCPGEVGQGKVFVLRITETEIEIDQHGPSKQTVYLGCLRIVGKSAKGDIKAAQTAAFHLKHAPSMHATVGAKKSPAAMVSKEKAQSAKSKTPKVPKAAAVKPTAKPMSTGKAQPTKSKTPKVPKVAAVKPLPKVAIAKLLPLPTETELLKNIMRTIEIAKDAQDAHILSAAFQAPVSINAFPNYLTIVSHPISLGCIRRRISGNATRPARQQYNLDNLLDDMQLMANNCQLFNGPCQLTNDAFELLQIAITRGSALHEQQQVQALSMEEQVPPPPLGMKQPKPTNPVRRVAWTEEDVRLLLQLVDQHGVHKIDAVHADFVRYCDDGHQRSKGALSIKYRDLISKSSYKPPRTPSVSGPAMRPPAIPTKKKVADVPVSTNATGTFTMTTLHRYEQSAFDSFDSQGTGFPGPCTSRPLSTRTPSTSDSTSMTTDEAQAAGKAATTSVHDSSISTSMTESVFDLIAPGINTADFWNDDEGEELPQVGHQWC